MRGRSEPEAQQVAERDTQLDQLVQIRKLLTLLLLKSGTTSEEIARALKVDSSTVRHEMPTRVERFPFVGGKASKR